MRIFPRKFSRPGGGQSWGQRPDRRSRRRTTPGFPGDEARYARKRRLGVSERRAVARPSKRDQRSRKAKPASRGSCAARRRDGRALRCGNALAFKGGDVWLSKPDADFQPHRPVHCVVVNNIGC